MVKFYTNYIYVKCKYCNKLVDYEFLELHNPIYGNDCVRSKLHWDTNEYYNKHNNINTKKCYNTRLKSCITCGKNYKENKYDFTKNQITKKAIFSRCNNCIKEKNIYVYSYIKNNNDILCLNKQLEVAVNMVHYNKIKQLLELGANPNYYKQQTIFCNIDKQIGPCGQLRFSVYENLLIYDKYGNQIPEQDTHYLRPINLLRILIFKLINSSTIENYENIFNCIKLLISFGANKLDGLNYYNYLYNKEVNEVINTNITLLLG